MKHFSQVLFKQIDAKKHVAAKNCMKGNAGMIHHPVIECTYHYWWDLSVVNKQMLSSARARPWLAILLPDMDKQIMIIDE